MPVEALEELLSPVASTQARLKGLLAVGLAHADLAAATGVSVSAVRNWTSGQAEPRKGGEIVIDDLRAAASILLKGGVAPNSVGRWLTSRGEADINNERPIDAVAEDPTLVLAAAHGRVMEDQVEQELSDERPRLVAVEPSADTT